MRRGAEEGQGRRGGGGSGCWVFKAGSLLCDLSRKRERFSTRGAFPQSRARSDPFRLRFFVCPPAVPSTSPFRTSESSSQRSCSATATRALAEAALAAAAAGAPVVPRMRPRLRSQPQAGLPATSKQTPPLRPPWLPTRAKKAVTRRPPAAPPGCLRRALRARTTGGAALGRSMPSSRNCPRAPGPRPRPRPWFCAFVSCVCSRCDARVALRRPVCGSQSECMTVNLYVQRHVARPMRRLLRRLLLPQHQGGPQAPGERPLPPDARPHGRTASRQHGGPLPISRMHTCKPPQLFPLRPCVL